jgi:hypothetical protein
MDSITFLKLVPVMYDTRVNRGIKIVPMISGPMGHGKTRLGYQVAALLTRHTGREYTCKVAQPMLMPLDDVRGMPIPQRDAAGTLIAQYTWPHLLPPKAEMENSVIVMDEFTKSQEEVTLALGNSFLEGVLGDAEIPDETFIICTGNRAGIDKSKDMTLPGHVVDRLLMVELKQSFRSWQPWAMANGVHAITTAFAGTMEAKVFGGGEPKRNEAFCSPRSLVAADALVQSFIEYDGKANDGTYYPVANTDLLQLIAGKIGESAAEDLKAYSLVGREMPTWDDIVRKPKLAKVPEVGSRLGAPALYAVAMMIASKMDSASIPKVVEYIKRIPDEFQVPILIKLGIDFPGEAASCGFIDVLMGSSDLTAAAMVYETSRN